MQSIISNNGFGFCKASSFRNCNHCLYRLRCINYTPIYTNNSPQTSSLEVFNLQSKQVFDQSSSSDTQDLIQENLVLKQKIQDLEGQVLALNESKNAEQKTSKQVNQAQETSAELQVYENKNLEVYQQDEVSLKPKKGIFGTKFVEDKPKKK